MVSSNGFRAMNYYVDPEEHIQVFQFDTQEYVFSVYFSFESSKYVVTRLDKELELDDFKFFDYETHRHMTVRQFVTDILNFGTSQLVVNQEQEYKLNNQLSQLEPVQFTVLS